MIGFDDLVALADKLGVIHAVKDKLVKQPDPAADKLITALEELAKVFEALNTEISKSVRNLLRGTRVQGKGGGACAPRRSRRRSGLCSVGSCPWSLQQDNQHLSEVSLYVVG